MNENYPVLICAPWHHDLNFTLFSFTSLGAKGAKQKEQHLLTFTVFFFLFPPSQLCCLCQTWEWCDQRHLVQVLDWCVEGGALGINKTRCQSSIHLCHQHTINKIAFSPTYCWSQGTQIEEHSERDVRTHTGAARQRGKPSHYWITGY